MQQITYDEIKTINYDQCERPYMAHIFLEQERLRVESSWVHDFDDDGKPIANKGYAVIEVYKIVNPAIDIVNKNIFGNFDLELEDEEFVAAYKGSEDEAKAFITGMIIKAQHPELDPSYYS